jgi:hypothetical protein
VSGPNRRNHEVGPFVTKIFWTKRERGKSAALPRKLPGSLGAPFLLSGGRTAVSPFLLPVAKILHNKELNSMGEPERVESIGGFFPKFLS